MPISWSSKAYKMLLSLTCVVFLAVLLVGCGDQSNGSSSSSNGPALNSDIVGTWVANGKCSLNLSEFSQAKFDPDGTLTLDNYVAKYSTPSANTVDFISPQATLQFTYSVSGNTLNLSDTSNHSCSLQKTS